MSVTANSAAVLRDRATAVLHGNDAGSWTKAAPRLYPHQWSWDSAFIAIGWAHLDVRRAIAELEELFAAQWHSGMVPHIVFRAGPGELTFPGRSGGTAPSRRRRPRSRFRRPGSASRQSMPSRCSGSGS